MCRLPRNSGASTSWNPKGLSRPVVGKLYLYLTEVKRCIVRSVMTIEKFGGQISFHLAFGSLVWEFAASQLVNLAHRKWQTTTREVKIRVVRKPEQLISLWIIFCYHLITWAGIAQSVQGLATCSTVTGSNPGGARYTSKEIRYLFTIIQRRYRNSIPPVYYPYYYYYYYYYYY
jgi:hypothetical protein